MVRMDNRLSQSQIIAPLLHHTEVYSVRLQLGGGPVHLVGKKFPTAEGNWAIRPIDILGKNRANALAGSVAMDVEGLAEIRVDQDGGRSQ